MNIAVLCAHPLSNYYRLAYLPGIILDIYDQERDARNFTGDCPVICHPPCAQWSALRKFAKFDKEQKYLAYFCRDVLARNGGIFEHPARSIFFDQSGWPDGKIYRVDQSAFGFPTLKPTKLFFHRCRPVSQPLNFNAIEFGIGMGKKKQIPKSMRSLTTESFNLWLIESIVSTFK